MFEATSLYSASLLTMVFYLAVASTCALRSVSRELRPSEHGLSYQKPPGSVPPAMKSFFNGSAMSSSSSSEPSRRRARNSSDGGDAFWSPERFGHVRSRENHVRTVMLVASLACGVGGLVLLVAAVLVYALLLRRRDK